MCFSASRVTKPFWNTLDHAAALYFYYQSCISFHFSFYFSHYVRFSWSSTTDLQVCNRKKLLQKCVVVSVTILHDIIAFLDCMFFVSEQRVSMVRSVLDYRRVSFPEVLGESDVRRKRKLNLIIMTNMTVCQGENFQTDKALRHACTNWEFSRDLVVNSPNCVCSTKIATKAILNVSNIFLKIFHPWSSVPAYRYTIC